MPPRSAQSRSRFWKRNLRLTSKLPPTASESVDCFQKEAVHTFLSLPRTHWRNSARYKESAASDDHKQLITVVFQFDPNSIPQRRIFCLGSSRRFGFFEYFRASGSFNNVVTHLPALKKSSTANPGSVRFLVDCGFGVLARYIPGKRSGIRSIAWVFDTRCHFLLPPRCTGLELSVLLPRAGLTPSPTRSPCLLIRRLTFLIRSLKLDFVGPPTAAHFRSFARDRSSPGRSLGTPLAQVSSKRNHPWLTALGEHPSRGRIPVPTAIQGGTSKLGSKALPLLAVAFLSRQCLVSPFSSLGIIRQETVSTVPRNRLPWP